MTWVESIFLVSSFYLILLKSEKYSKIEEKYLELELTERLNGSDVKLMLNEIIFHEIADYGYFCVLE